MGGFPGSVLLSQGDVMNTSATKTMPLGTRGYTRDGRVFRYTRAGATALKAGLLCQGAVPSSVDLGYLTGTTKLKANTTAFNIIQGTSQNLTSANSYAEGFIWLRTSSTVKGAGQYAQIKSHTPGTTSSAKKIAVGLYDGAFFVSGASTVVGTTAAAFGLIRNPYDKVVVKPAGRKTALVVGVPVRPVAANYYFWMQTWGPCPLRVTGILNAGQVVGPSSGATAGIIDGCTSTKASSAAASLKWSQVRELLAEKVGNVMTTGVAGEYNLVFLKLAP